MQPLTRAVPRLRLVIIDFVVAAACYTAAAYTTARVNPTIYLLYEGGGGAIALTSLTIVIGIYFQQLHSLERMKSRVELAVQLIRALGIAFLVQAVVDYLGRGTSLPLPVMLAGSAFALISLFLWRLLYYGMTCGVVGSERILLVGATDLMRQIAAGIHSTPGYGMTVAGYVDDGRPAGTVIEGTPVLGPLAKLDEICREMKPACVFADFTGDQELPDGLIRRILAAGIPVEKSSVLYEQVFKRCSIDRLRSSAVLFTGEMAPSPALLAVQSIHNNLLALAVVALLAPVMLAIAALIRITSKGPAREFQQVMGWKGIPFKLARFRCTGGAAGSEPTPLGRVLMRLHLDGLPQLLNVLRGELAFIGPRPVACSAAEAITDSLPSYRLRFSVKPGLIGWSDVNSSSKDPRAELEYDLYYVKNLSFALDCYILLHALGRLFKKRPIANAAASGRR